MQSNRFKKLRLIGTACVVLASATPVCADDYQLGLAAYIDGEYREAQRFWLKAANQKEPKSMFNLGLLHEQKKLTGARIEKALNWYRLAAENGYPPAGYHLAQRMLERGGSDDDAIGLINRAAKQGYAPAKRYLGIEQENDAESQVIEPTAITSSSLTAKTKVQSEIWINRQRGQNWTIQLLAFKEKKQVVAFVLEHGLHQKAAYFSENNGSDQFYKLVFGSFESKDKAAEARDGLSPALQQHGPWLRTWSSVHKVTQK